MGSYVVPETPPSPEGDSAPSTSPQTRRKAGLAPRSPASRASLRRKPGRREALPSVRPRVPPTRLFPSHLGRMQRLIRLGVGWSVLGGGKQIIPHEREWHAVRTNPPGLSRTTAAQLRSVQRTLDHRNIIRMLEFEGYAHSVEQKGKTTTFEFCDQGTLHQLIKKYPSGLPERFVWHVLLSLLQALLWLHTGKTDSKSSLNRNFRPLVHNYINPRTIFLRSRGLQIDTDEHGEEIYPDVKLGNFKKANKLNLLTEAEDYEDSENIYPRVTVESATHFEAPELFWSPDHGPYRCASDLWSLGAVMVALMGGVRFSHEKRDAPAKAIRLTHLSIHKDAWKAEELPQKYSLQLRGLLAELLILDPRQRLDTEAAYQWCWKLNPYLQKNTDQLSPRTESVGPQPPAEGREEEKEITTIGVQVGDATGSVGESGDDKHVECSPPTPSVPGAWKTIAGCIVS